MALIFWRTAVAPGGDRAEAEKQVDEQWPLPTRMYIAPGEGQPLSAVSPTNPLVIRDIANQASDAKVRAQIAVSSSVATLIAPYNARRKQIKITNTTGTQVVWLGVDAGVLATNGDLLGSTQGSNFVTDARQAVWGLSATAAQTVSVYETEYVS